MRLLVLGGSIFLSRAVAAAALERGHEVTCANRGRSGSVPSGARAVVWDRADPPPAALDSEYDAVLDVTRVPSHARSAVAAIPNAHWIYISSVSVYADTASMSDQVAAPEDEDLDLTEHPEAYGPMKVSCEQSVQSGARSCAIIRPGLIVGPGDPTGRYSYWPQRLAEGDEVLGPGVQTDVVQVIDVRDLARWCVTIGEQQTSGVFDGVGPLLPMGDLIAQTAAGVDSTAEVTWTSQEFLTDQQVAPWMGEQSLPLWLPRPEYDAMMGRDPAPSQAVGLRFRSIEDTARATLEWLKTEPDSSRTGMTREFEMSVLESWHNLPE